MCRTAVGKLLYMCQERVDIMYSVKETARKITCPTESDEMNVKAHHEIRHLHVQTLLSTKAVGFFGLNEDKIDVICRTSHHAAIGGTRLSGVAEVGIEIGDSPSFDERETR